MKRRFARIAVVLATVGILFLYPLVAPPAHRIDDRHFEMVQPGMTAAEVAGIFGVPAGEYDWAVTNTLSIWMDIGVALQNRPVADTPAIYKQLIAFRDADGPIAITSWHSPNYGCVKAWTSRHGAFHVSFDGCGRVIRTGWVAETRIEPPWRRWWRQWTSK